uniref:Uncharacterized protein n=1 Tax=Anguilla anguilla TaxID=7936 RepID=A0A0E9S387_ANGAN
MSTGFRELKTYKSWRTPAWAGRSWKDCSACRYLWFLAVSSQLQPMLVLCGVFPYRSKNLKDYVQKN